MPVDGREWARSMYAVLRDDRRATNVLRQAAVTGDLARWTRALTRLVAESLQEIGLEVAAKGHRCKVLPVGREEYLAIDVTGFPDANCAWRFPFFVCELENSARDEIVAYALWKVLSIRQALRVVFCYRGGRSDAPRLIGTLTDQVVGSMALLDREELGGDTLVFVGSRNEAGTFPYGFFQSWRLNRNLGQFERFGWQE